MSKKIPTLHQTQEDFSQYLVHGADEIFSAIAQPPRGTVAERLLIYGDAYWLRLTQILERHYPTLCAYLGEDFVILGQAYLDQHPSHFANVRYFGDQLATFLRTDPDYADAPFLAECADFEWALSLATDAADADIISGELMQAIPAERWPELRLNLHPSIQLGHYEWNVLELWSQAKAEQPLSDWRQLSEEENKDVILWREGHVAYYQDISPSMMMITRLFRQGQSCSEICDHLLEIMSEEEVPKALMQTIHFLFARQLVTQILSVQPDQSD